MQFACERGLILVHHASRLHEPTEPVTIFAVRRASQINGTWHDQSFRALVIARATDNPCHDGWQFLAQAFLQIALDLVVADAFGERYRPHAVPQCVTATAHDRPVIGRQPHGVAWFECERRLVQTSRRDRVIARDPLDACLVEPSTLRRFLRRHQPRPVQRRDVRRRGPTTARILAGKEQRRRNRQAVFTKRCLARLNERRLPITASAIEDHHDPLAGDPDERVPHRHLREPANFRVRQDACDEALPRAIRFRFKVRIVARWLTIPPDDPRDPVITALRPEVAVA